MNSPDFVHLHLHTPYSLLKGVCRPKLLAKRVKELGMKACAITDLGNMFGVVEFYDACMEEGIKPIIGCELFLQDVIPGVPSEAEPGLVLLCQNQIGYHNLIKLTSAGCRKQTGIHPAVTMEELAAHSEGLIALSGGKNGKIPRLILQKNYEGAKKEALRLSEIFSRGRFYIEIFDHDEPFSQSLKLQLIRLSEETGIAPAAANDVYFLHPADRKDHEILCSIASPNHSEEEVCGEEYYLKSQQEMESRMVSCPEAVFNTARIAGMCNLRLEFGKRLLPQFHKDGVSDNTAYLRYRAFKGFNVLLPNGTEEDRQRLLYELSVIEKMGFVDYFLIVSDFIRYARRHDIPVGPGRGSGAGSLTAYCIGITELNPLRYGLLFERFLNPERVSMPDFDVDFCYERRGEVIDYINEKYGREQVAQIVTFGTLAAKASIRDVGKALHMDSAVCAAAAKLIPGGPKMTLDKALSESRQLSSLYEENDQVRRLIDACRRIEGFPRHTATHAAGVVITPGPVDDYVPLAQNDGVPVTQYNMTDLERLGLLKIDFLGLRTLTVLHDCEKAVQKILPDFSLQKLPLDEQAVYEMLSCGETEGVFQLESGGIRRVLRQMEPKCFEDIIAVIALYRPGPMDSIPDYIARSKNPQLVSYLHPSLKPILEDTRGCIIYQEQVMQICRQLAGYSYGHADIVRRAMSKKKADVMETERESFLSGCAENQIDRKTAGLIFDQMVSFASYAFNKSHAAAYAMLTYRTAFCRRFFPAEFFAAQMNAFYENTAKTAGYMQVCKGMGISLQDPDINLAEADFTVHKGQILYGLKAVKGVGKALAERIVLERETNGSYTSFRDFIRRMAAKELNKNAVLSLISSGAFDSFPKHNRNEMLSVCEDMVNFYHQSARGEIAGQLSLFGEQEEAEPVSFPVCAAPTAGQRLEMERQTVGTYLSGHPLDELEAEMPENCRSLSELLALPVREQPAACMTLAVCDRLQEGRTRRGEKIIFGTLSDREAGLDFILFPAVCAEAEQKLSEGAVLVFQGTLRLNERGKYQLAAERLFLPEELAGQNVSDRKKPAAGKNIYIRVQSKKDLRLAVLPALFAEHPGEDDVYLFFADTRQYAVWKNQQISFDKFLSNCLKKLFGNTAVVSKIRKKA